MIPRVQRPILLKLIILILAPLCLIYGSILVINYRINKESAIQATEAFLNELSAHHATDLDGKLKEVMQQTQNLANLIQLYPTPDSTKLKNYLQQNVKQNPFLSGFAFAYEPYRYTLDKRLYCPYLCRSGEDINPLDVSNFYDYTLNEWYSVPAKSGDPTWTEPYLGGSSGILNATFTIPVFVSKQLLGVAAADLSLSELTAELSKLKLEGAYVFLISKSGRFISHPDSNWIMHKSLDDIAKDQMPEFAGLYAQMQSKSLGIIKTGNGSKRKWIVYQTIASTQWIFASVISETVILKKVRQQLLTQILLMSFGLAVIVSIIIWTAIGITRPIRKLSSRARQISAGDLDSSLPQINSKDEIEELTLVFNGMTQELKAQIASVAQMAEARAKVESELSIARQIQESLLPHVFPPFPQRTEFALYAQMLPARDVAGDFYDFFFLDANRLLLLIADVSGKGIPAALFMAVTRTLIKTVCESDITPSQALAKVNDILAKENENCMFTTLFMGIYDVKTGSLCYANAGHLPPLLFCKDGSYSTLASFGDPALGIVENHIYSQSCIDIEVDNRLVFFTDGVTEAMNKDDELYGLERFIEHLKNSLEEPIELVQKRLQEDLISFQNGNLADDITMLFFSRKL